MPKGLQTQNDVLNLVLITGTSIGWIANANGYMAAHNGDPSSTGIQTLNETAYGGYTRIAVPRSVGGWTITASQAQNAALIQFPTCVSSSDTLTYCSYGQSNTGIAGQIYYSGQLTTPLAISVGIQPQFAIHALTIIEG